MFQHQINMAGKCGICGDAHDLKIRPHEPPDGRYANGVIVSVYQESDVISATVDVTAFHKGYFQFRICPHNDVHTPATKECLDQYLLQSLGGDTEFYPPRDGLHTVQLQLPVGLYCQQCVFQWKYNTGECPPPPPQKRDIELMLILCYVCTVIINIITRTVRGSALDVGI